MAQCAAAAGISKSIPQWAKTEGCGAFRNSRVYLLELTAWIFRQTNGKVNYTEFNKELDARLKQINIAKEQRQVIEKTEVEECIKEIAAIYYAGLKRMTIEFPKMLEMRSAAEIKTMCDATHKDILKRLELELQKLVTPENRTPSADDQH